ncbi:MAG: TIGR02206 family membrane protein [Candidatus Brocadiia bacterium]
MAPRFVTLGPSHLAGMALAVAAGAALAWAARARASARLDRLVRWALAAACLGWAAGALGWLTLGAGHPLRSVLPLHLCDVSALLAPVVLLRPRRGLYELLYFWGVGGALQAMATPAVTWGFPHPECLLFFSGHGAILASALYATVAMRLRPVPRSILRAWLLTNVYGLLILPLNVALGTNYLFLMHKPQQPSLLDVMGPWPWYLVVLDVVALGVIAACYLPFLVADRVAARSGGGGPPPVGVS